MIEQPRDLAGQVALITGAGAGIGAATARLFAARGARVAALDVRAEAARAVAEGLERDGGEACWVQADVTSRAAVDAAVAAVLARCGQLDILVNNVGGSKVVPFWEMSEEQWDGMLALNLKAAFLCARAVVGHMMARRQGNMVLLSSSQGATPAPGRAHYSAAKAGIVGLTRTLALELAPYGIRVNAVAPGTTNTERVRGNNDDAAWARLMAAHPLGRVAEPADVAEVIAFLASPRSRHLTGQLVHVSGGQVMPCP